MEIKVAYKHKIVELPKLKKGEVYISHVGDHEYCFNVFGSVHTNLDLFFKRLKERYGELCFIKYLSRDNKEGDEIFVIGSFGWEVACLTIEKINPPVFPIGDL